MIKGKIKWSCVLCTGILGISHAQSRNPVAMAAADAKKVGTKTVVASEAGLGAGASAAAAFCKAAVATRTTSINVASSFTFIASISLVLSAPQLRPL